MRLPGIGEWIIPIIIILLLFGAKRIPDLAKSLGKGLREFRKGLRNIQEDIADADKDAPPTDEPAGDEKVEKASALPGDTLLEKEVRKT